MKKSKILLSLLVVAVMVISMVSLIACTEEQDQEIEIVMWAPAGAQTFYKQWADKWAEEYNKTVEGKKYTVIMGVEAEKTATTQMVSLGADGADVFCFVDDQMDILLEAKLLSPLGNPANDNAALAKDIASRNTANSVASASDKDGMIYAFPMQSDNTFFLFYDSSIVNADDLTTWDKVFETVTAYNSAHSTNYRVQLDMGDPWYQSAFFFSFGGEANLNSTNFGTDEVGLKALKAIHQMSMQPLLKVVAANDISKEFKKSSQKIAVGVAGPFAYTETMATNPDVKLAPLPSIVLDEETVQMKPFLGNKLMGVNALSKEIVASRSLANYLTSEEVQKDKMLKLSASPSNINASSNVDTSTIDEIATVLNAQASYSVAQINLPGGYWEAIKTPCNAMYTAGSLSDRTKDKYYVNDQYVDSEIKTLLTNMIAAMTFEN